MHKSLSCYCRTCSLRIHCTAEARTYTCDIESRKAGSNQASFLQHAQSTHIENKGQGQQYYRLLNKPTCVTRLGIDNRVEGDVSPSGLSCLERADRKSARRGGSRTRTGQDRDYHDMRYFLIIRYCACHRHDIYHEKQSFLLSISTI